MSRNNEEDSFITIFSEIPRISTNNLSGRKLLVDETRFSVLPYIHGQQNCAFLKYSNQHVHILSAVRNNRLHAAFAKQFMELDNTNIASFELVSD